MGRDGDEALVQIGRAMESAAAEIRLERVR